jgi:hypothetical protein
VTAEGTLWDRVCTTDAKYTKEFSREGGFKGTAINATWLVREASKTFGPCGIGWGFSVIDEKYVTGAAGTVVHVVRLELWYEFDGKRGRVEQFGQTTMVGVRGNGKAYTDEEAPKKSITDATSKCLSLLGFGSDIHLGMYDDNKYVNDRRREAGDSDTPADAPKPSQGTKPNTGANSGPREPAKTTERTTTDGQQAIRAAIADLPAVKDEDTFRAWFVTHLGVLRNSKGDERKKLYASAESRGKAIDFEQRDLRAFYEEAVQAATKNRKVA